VGLDVEAQAGRSVPAAPRAPVPTLFCNARVLTMDDAGSEFDTLLISDGRIQWVGNADADAVPEVGDDTVRVDCNGRTILPGFVEPHMHLSAIAMLRRFENVGPFRYPTVSGALARLKEVAADTDPGAWIIAP
jgi:predicted amidohydrolase YtcJ